MLALPAAMWKIPSHPFLDTLRAFSFRHPVQWYYAADSLHTSVLACAFWALYSLIMSLATNNYSQVDKLWSILPALYMLHFLIHSPLSARLVIMSILVFLWSARLTYNFYRKGGYTGTEDYRWPYIRKHIFPHPLAWHIFNTIFISTAQNILLWSIVAPTAYAAAQNPTRLVVLDLLAIFAFLALWTLEALADNQQWAFQTEKHRLLRACEAHAQQVPEPYRKGFLTTGLFSVSRHPNFFAEQTIWLVYYLFRVAATRTWYHPAIFAPLALIALFQGSTWLTECIAAQKYPEYKDYQKSVSKFIPWFPRRSQS